MSYNKKVWKSGDRITKEALNNMENGIEAAHQNSGGSGTSYDDTEIKTDINTIKTDLGTDELTTTAKDVKGAVNELNTQYKDIANKTVVENNKLYLVKSDGTKIDEGTDLPVGGEVPANVVLFEKTEETPINKETSIPINSQNGTTYYLKVNDDGLPSIQNTSGETVWSGSGSSDVVQATGITLNSNAETIMVGTTVTLSATVEPVDCTQEVKWYTNNATIATVENGVITGQGIGNCTITAKVGSQTATCKIAVEKYTLLIWNKGSVNEEITGGWDYTSKADYAHLNDDGSFTLMSGNAAWAYKHFVTKNAIDLSKYNSLILEIDVSGRGECQCQTSDNGTSVTSTYKYLSVDANTHKYTVDISELTNVTHLSFNSYSTNITFNRIGLE